MDDSEFRQLHRRELVDDRLSGASQLARAALDSLGEFAGSCSAADTETLRSELLDFGEELQSARPSMAPIENLIQHWLDTVSEIDAEDPQVVRREAAAAAQRLSDHSIQAVASVARNAVRLVGANRRIITHSLSSTVLEALRELAPMGLAVITPESRPGLEGRTLARHLDQMHIPVDFITDAQIGHFCRRADLALVGADTLLGDGAVVNKAGTCLLALAARDQGIPLYVCCESFKRVPYGRTSFEPEALDPDEIEAPKGAHITPCNVYFDITPANLVDAWIDETGIQHAQR